MIRLKAKVLKRSFSISLNYNGPKFDRKKYIEKTAPDHSMGPSWNVGRYEYEPTHKPSDNLLKDKTVSIDPSLHRYMAEANVLSSITKDSSAADPIEQYKREAMNTTAAKFMKWSINADIIALKIKMRYKKASRLISAPHLISKLPKKLQAYAKLSRADKPIGTYLLFIPGAISISLADADMTNKLLMMSLFLWGSFWMRGAGCIVNDMWDKDIDKNVERTRGRPLASGQLSMDDAKKSLAVHLAASVAVLPFMPKICFGLACASLPLVAMYPLAKRYTNAPQAVLGLTFNWGAIMGYAAMTGYVDPLICGYLYASTFLWTMIYDTVYAFQDIEDDAMLGVKSMALLLTPPPQKPFAHMSVKDRCQALESRKNYRVIF